MKINELVQENDMSSFLKDLQKNNPKFKNLRIHGDPEHDELRRQDAEKRETDRASAHQKSQDAEAQDHADLPHLEAEYAKMKKEYEALGGSDWQYADREQNLSAGERKARSMESGLHHLANRIRRAKKHGEQGVAKEITAGDMARSAHMQGFKIGREGSGNNMDRAKAQHGENFKHYNAGFLKGRNEKAKSLKAFGQGYNKKRPQPVAEGFNGEYDDEAGMAHTNLLTSARAVMGLLKTIDDKDNLPEWVQEKIAKAEMMLVGVWDYLQSQKEQGIDPQQDANEADDPYFESLRAQVEELAKK